MKVSLNWLNDFIKLNLSNQEISDKLTQLGLESTFKKSGKSFSGIVLGKVIQCEPHPNADKLSVCMVDIGDSDNYEIVCGAPNVKTNIFVPVATIGAELNDGDFKIKKTKLRGVVSNGMICSGKEIGYNDDHEGILILKTDEALGTPIDKIINFSEDVVFDLDLTPNRGDCLSHLGVARELGVISRQKISRNVVDIEENGEKVNGLVSLQIDEPEACPRYVARVVKGVNVGISPKWLINRLESIGLKSINNIVDLANYVLMNTGHPMHTFDLGSVSEKNINVRFAKKNEKFITIDNIERKLEDFHLLICDAQKPIALAGIMGGMNSEITNTTTDILIESAYFDPKIIRKSAKSLDLSTEASRRFERDTDIEALVASVNELAHLIKEVAGGDISEGIIDEYPRKVNKTIINFSIKKCNSLLGVELKEKDIKEIFEMLDIKMLKDKNGFSCHVPSFRNDLERDVDLFEEVARIMGYDNISSSHGFSGSFSSFVKDEQSLDDNVRMQLKSIGFHEHYSNSLLSEEHTKHFKSGKPVRIKNPLSKEMEFMRNSILPGLIMAASYNEKRQLNNFKLFEIGAIHNLSNKSYTNTREKFHLGLVWHDKTELHWRKHGNRDIFNCKGEISQFLNSLGFDKVRFKACKIQGFHMSLKIFHDKIQLGCLGILNDELKNEYDIKSNLMICDISMMELRQIKKHEKFIFHSPSQYPSINRDIALQVKQDVSSGTLFDTINKEGGDLLKGVSLFDIYEFEDVGGDNKSLAFSLKFQSNSSTLTDNEVDPIINRILESLNKCHGAIQR